MPPKTNESPVVHPFQIDEGIEVVTAPPASTLEISTSVATERQRYGDDQPCTSRSYSSEAVTTPKKTMDESLSSFAREALEEFITPTASQVPSLCFRQHFSPTDAAMPDMGVSTPFHQEESLGHVAMELQETGQQISVENAFTSENLNLGITRQEVLTLTNVFSRSPTLFYRGRS